MLSEDFIGREVAIWKQVEVKGPWTKFSTAKLKP